MGAVTSRTTNVKKKELFEQGFLGQTASSGKNIRGRRQSDGEGPARICRQQKWPEQKDRNKNCHTQESKGSLVTRLPTQ